MIDLFPWSTISNVPRVLPDVTTLSLFPFLINLGASPLPTSRQSSLLCQINLFDFFFVPLYLALHWLVWNGSHQLRTPSLWRDPLELLTSLIWFFPPCLAWCYQQNGSILACWKWTPCHLPSARSPQLTTLSDHLKLQQTLNKEQLRFLSSDSQPWSSDPIWGA